MTRKPRLPAIEYIRGISMLGVIAIHVGSQYLGNPAANMHLTALLEIISRFSVPIFFFISAFGLFYNLDLEEPIDYKHFYIRRARTVLIPYLIWSFFYMFISALRNQDFGLFMPGKIASYLFFGFASYQLYFLVILLWFYLLMPFWVHVLKSSNPTNLLFLFLFQLTFNYYSSFQLFPDRITANPFYYDLFQYRMNYWFLHYIFIFVLGAFFAVHYGAFQKTMQTRRWPIRIFFWGSMLALLGYYYQLIFEKGYRLDEAINTAHQLCPLGVIYTIAACIFFFTIFTYQKYPGSLNKYFAFLGKHSYFAYLVHPIFIGILSYILKQQQIVMSIPVTLMYYVVTVLLSMGAAAAFRKIGEKVPVLNALTIGLYPKK